MSITLSAPSLSLHSSLSHAPPHHRPVAFLRHLTLRHNHHRRLFCVAAAIPPEPVAWTKAPLAGVLPATETLFYVTVDVSNSPDLVANFACAGQYLHLRIPKVVLKPTTLYIASPPSLAEKTLEFEFLVRSVPHTTAAALCKLEKGHVVELSGIQGSGFDIDQLSPPKDYPTVLLFATGYGISPVRSLIETGFGADKRSDVRLYYGAENPEAMAYKERFKNWEASGVKVIPVYSRPGANWTSESGYVQGAHARAKKIADPRTTGAVLSGNPNMIEEVTALLVAEGVSREKILLAE
ncbi:fruit protein pKIWI502-like [Actinidia eriantha]|uniref:fruit protein pKIWI502-like n=1 Tax=Actinidia eriantha TaxID=165200 RepID=UPI002584170D|nr:fruit protein pKIWI502-like [Actinidia eriantha]